MESIKNNTKEITRDEAFKLVYGEYPFTYQLKTFSSRFNNKKSIIIARQVGLGDSLIERTNRKYYVSDLILKA